jgi:hypothetical protein
LVATKGAKMMTQTHRPKRDRDAANAGPVRSLMLVAQQRLIEVYFGEPAVVVIQATKLLIVQTETDTLSISPGQEWRGNCRWLRFHSSRSGAVVLRYSGGSAFVEEL